MDKKIVIILIFITFLILGVGIWLATKTPAKTYTGLDSFAQCLSSKDITMYGAYWCPHCINTKKSFGDSFKYVKYIECTVETKTCTDKNITGYPTWIMGDGTRLEGEQSLDQLAKASGCPLK